MQCTSIGQRLSQPPPSFLSLRGIEWADHVAIFLLSSFTGAASPDGFPSTLTSLGAARPSQLSIHWLPQNNGSKECNSVFLSFYPLETIHGVSIKVGRLWLSWSDHVVHDGLLALVKAINAV